MAKIVFTNPETARLFEALTEYDQEVEIPPRPGGTCSCRAYRGKISDITPCAAERYVEYRGNLIAKKENPEPAPIESGVESQEPAVNTTIVEETAAEEKSFNKKFNR